MSRKLREAYRAYKSGDLTELQQELLEGHLLRKYDLCADLYRLKVCETCFPGTEEQGADNCSADL